MGITPGILVAISYSGIAIAERAIDCITRLERIKFRTLAFKSNKLESSFQGMTQINIGADNSQKAFTDLPK